MCSPVTFPGVKCTKSNEREQNFSLRDGQGKDRPGAGYALLSQVHPLASCVYSLSRRTTLTDNITQAPWPSGFRWTSGEGGWGCRQKARGQEERDSSDFFPPHFSPGFQQRLCPTIKHLLSRDTGAPLTAPLPRNGTSLCE